MKRLTMQLLSGEILVVAMVNPFLLVVPLLCIECRTGEEGDTVGAFA